MAGYVGQQFSAILAMMRGDNWQDKLDVTTDGVFRSFWAIPLSLPLVFLSGQLANQLLRQIPDYALLGRPEYPLAFEALLNTLTFLLAWGVSLMLIVGFCQQTQKSSRAAPLIVSYNWSILFIQVINCAAIVIVALMQLPELLLLAGLLLQGFWFFMRWCLIRQSLESDIAPTIGIIIMIFLASSVIGSVLTDLGGQFYEALLLPEAEMKAG